VRLGDPLRATIASRAGGRCEYCHYPEHFSPSAFEVEHIVPRSAGGLTEINNLALACSHCNAHKAVRRIGFDPHTETEVRLFNPRIDNWNIHFFLNRDTGKIQGKSPMGRATVETLLMNAEQPIRSRRNLIRLQVV
jgi:5-methylcytosine-specific restriction endonuclease McrA